MDEKGRPPLRPFESGSELAEKCQEIFRNVDRDFGATFDFAGDETLALLVTAYEVDASGRFDSLDRTVVPITYYPAGSTACAE